MPRTSKSPLRLRLSVFCSVVLMTASWSQNVGAAPIEIEVIGRLQLDASFEEDGDGSMRVVGRLRDELGRPLRGEISARPKGKKVPLILRRCDYDRQTTLPILQTADNGEFCGELLGNAPLLDIVIEAKAPHFFATERNLTITTTSHLSAPSFVNAPQTLGHTGQTEVVELLASPGTPPILGAALELSLHCKSEQFVIGRENITESRLLRFEFETPDLPFGACRLVATVSAPGHARISQERDVVLVGVVELNELEQKESDDEVHIKIAVMAGEQPVNHGIVEAYNGETFVGTAATVEGQSIVRVSADSDERTLVLRYISSDPALLAGAPLSVSVPASTRKHSWAPLHIFGLSLFGLWLFYAWLRPRQKQLKEEEPALPQAAVLLERGNKTGAIHGRVLDAHTGAPLHGASVYLKKPQADAESHLAQQLCDQSGHFAFDVELGDQSLLTVYVECENYMSFQSAVVRSELTIYLPTRRRALIDQMVAWAKRQGFPWDKRPAPTSGHIGDVARDRGRAATAHWADKVGEGAYGPLPQSEGQVLDLKEPGPDR